ncbi:MAG: bifunctional 4-hydroxy-2-oxoglutarate aldolase/2-dehydro-3-deoxy-phosphogluconate aldolase [Anaerolineae bacterium]|nr:bifunctional 4-hydroxy-2-oxoglutarate aldolase/2-dehydro-3-deoxy-phosphogluconate aldolase [Anaerolineae bacterium]
MARFTRLEVLNAVIDSGLVPIFYHADAEVAKQVAKAVHAGGARVLEFTNRGDFAFQVFTDLAQYCAAEMPAMILGVGSVVDAPTASMYLASSANFIVGPNLNPEVARVCNRRKVAYMPGTATPTEITNAEEMGVEICKIFPGDSVGGPGFVKALLAPCPWTRIMPTGGVDATEDSIKAWIKAGASCLGMGSRLIRKDWVAAGDWDAIADNVRRVLTWIQEARSGAAPTKRV